ncbi:DUF4412 domain-containing protein [Candidatus Magnetomonas plexicatena]|uniref:DUF4412 domain-containing protein n=1 Tax=Candidatus Magnetomonas plexicatena TaxID=2552947 RepID=UPI0011052722|nr:DUF4412 domain-containing protein [Nitrospirales bacterium LBB_01]
MKRAVICLVVFISMLLSVTEAVCAPPENFTAEMTVMDMTMKIAKMGSKTRIEAHSAPGLVTILLSDDKKIIYLSTKAKKYALDLMQSSLAPMYEDDLVLEKRPIGTQTIAGHRCERYDALFSRKDRPDEKLEAMIWEAEDLGNLIIRYEYETKDSEGKSTVVTAQLRNIVIGGAKASMFAIPKGYKKVSSVSKLTTNAATSGKEK